MPLIFRTILVIALGAGSLLTPRVCLAQAPRVKADQLHRVTTVVPFPRGLVIVDGQLYVLSRGRVREAGGVDAQIDDQAGTIFVVDPNVAGPASEYPINENVRNNGEVFAAPTSPPFRLFDRSKKPATLDRHTDRPYCGLRYDPATQNFFVCAFSGIDKPDAGKEGRNFSKNLSDAVFRFDTRSKAWSVVEQHDPEAGGSYPHQDPVSGTPPHGWLNGPNNCLAVGHWLYVVSKDNSLLIRYDLRAIAKDPAAPAPPATWTLDHKIFLQGLGLQEYYGHSMLAYREGWLYLGYRTSSKIVRIKLDDANVPVQPMEAQLVAEFDAFDPKTRKSADLTDMAFGREGDLYVVTAQPAGIYRFTPDPARVFDGRTTAATIWADLATLTGNPKMKSENLLVDDAGRVFVTSGDAYNFQSGAGGVVWRIDPAAR